MSPWAFLAAAIGLEVTGTFLLKLSHGFEKWQWGSLSILCYSACFWVLAPAMRALPVGVVYAIWSGVGIVAAGLLGWMVFGERLGPLQLACVGVILGAAVVLQVSTRA